MIALDLQTRIFCHVSDVGRTIVEQCVKGYNGVRNKEQHRCLGNHKDRGIIPRCMEYLFALIAKEEQMVSSVKYLCKASYIEIYNEMIYDLLDNSTTARATREDIKRGVYVDGVTEESIHNPEDAYKLFEQGAANRHISATAMNRESSRSHTVLTLTIQSMALVDGINHIRESRFNLVDLAGSERQKQANTEGQRLREAGNINRSLLCLGSVINALGEIAGGHSRHVHYRDSRLTFLLKDSLGGNSNTFIVANVSPSALCYQESLSTLRFAQRAKMIRNKAVVNEDVQGNVNELRAEIQRLKAELASKQSPGGVEDTSVTNKLLRETLSRLRKEQEEHLAMAQKGFMLDDACKAREKQIQSAQLIIKFKDSALAANRKGATNAVLEAEKGALQEEVAQLRRQLDFHPEMLKVKAENLSLRDMLQKYERYQASLEDFEEKEKKDKEYVYNLAEKIVQLGEENEALRLKVGATTPKSHQDMEDVDFPKVEGIEDLMQESPPKVRDADRRFSSDMKSLLQRVTKSRQAEYRRLSGNNHGRPEPQVVDGGDHENQGPHLSGSITPQSKAVGLANDTNDSPLGKNLSDNLSAHSTMHSEDTVEMTLLKRDIDRLKDENSVLASLEKDYADSQFQLITMEKCLEQATNQAEQLGQELQNSRNALATMEQEASRDIMDLNKEMKEQIELMETMRQASIKVEEELDRLKANYLEADQQLKATAKDLDESRHRLVENQKEYDHQVEYNMKRINEFQEKEAKWEDTKADLLRAKEDLEKQLEQERTRTTSTRSELEKEQHKLTQDFEHLGAEKSRLEGLCSTLEKELQDLRKLTAEASQEYNTKVEQALEQHESELKAEMARKEVLEADLKTALEHVEALESELALSRRSLESKTEEVTRSLQENEQVAQDSINALKKKHLKEMEESRSAMQKEAEDVLQTTKQSLIESHQQEIDALKTEAETQTRAVEEVRKQLQQTMDEASEALQANKTMMADLAEAKELYRVLGLESDSLKKEKIRLEALIETLTTTSQKLESTLEEQKQELGTMTLQAQQDQWEKRRLETAKVELQEKVSEMVRKMTETEQKLEEARDSNRMLEMEYRTVQDELEHQLSKARNDLAVKTNENMLNEEYKRKFRELRAQFADLGPTVTERQQQGFHERELKRTMELEKAREEVSQATIKHAQLEANLILAQGMNEQLLEDAKANTMKIADEMEKRLKEVEVQRRNAEQEVEQALEAVQQKTTEMQALQEQAWTQKERLTALEEELKDERAKIERLEGSLNEGKAMLEEQEANEKEQTLQESRRKFKEEQLIAQRQLLMNMKEEQQALVQQQLQRRDKTRALFEGLATENGKLMEQVRDLGMVNESMMKHQNPKQKLQYHVKIKQENNELRIENQRLMFKAIELEERLGNKENVESLRKQVWAMHGRNPLQSSLETTLDVGHDTDSISMEGAKALDDDVAPTQRSDSGSPLLSSEASSISGTVPKLVKEDSSVSETNARSRSRTPGAVVGLKRKAAMNDATSAVLSAAGRKRPVAAVGTHSTSVTAPARPRTLSSASLTSVSTASARPASSSSTSRPAAVTVVKSTGEAPLGPRARAKAAADAALAAAKLGHRQPISRVTKRTPSVPSLSGRPSNHDDILRKQRSGGAVTKPLASALQGTQRAAAREARSAASSSKATGAGAGQFRSQANAHSAGQDRTRGSLSPAAPLVSERILSPDDAAASGATESGHTESLAEHNTTLPAHTESEE
ncbi:Kinesin-like protein kif15 [Mortierella alpina]|uniref:Kinesin-like protein kif15 n=1 Tax=Mortierella alpina TaxID=64518 RepID=A0A9P6J4I5_MORAP|nr:Kinesin-like protein kif15 [Mortierella alpina]